MTQEDLQDLANKNPAGYEKYAFCGYRRIWTYGEWFPVDYDTHVKRLQAKIEALEAQISHQPSPT